MTQLTNITLFMILLITACNSKQESEVPVTTNKPSEAFHVRSAPVVMSDLSDLIHVTGVIESDTEAKPSFKTGGVISRVYVREGDHVKKGQIIARLDMTEIEAQATQAKFALDKAMRDEQRVKNLYADSIVTTEQLQNAGTAVDLAKKTLQIAEFNVAYSEVRSPIDGTVISQLMHEGEITGPGIPVVYIIGVRQSDWKIVAGLTDKDWGRVRVGDKATIRLDAYPEWQIEG
jgi:RND family efflux transporter MFP subunit